MDFPDSLERPLRTGRLAGAYLLFGRPPGTFSEVVLELFRRVVCPNLEDRVPCGTCPDCRQLTEGVHPDQVVLPSLESADDEGGTGRIGVDDVRERLLEPASLTPARSPYKLFWLRDARRLTPEASNTLLKVLEEPSGEALFVLTARSRWDCLPTVRSRCQWIRFAPAVRRIEDPRERVRELRSDRPLEEESLEQYEALLEGRSRSLEVDWTRDRARDFLVYLLTLVHRKHTRGSTDLAGSADERLSYRLVPALLSRLEELERGGDPVVVVNSLLETIFYPREFTPWAPAT